MSITLVSHQHCWSLPPDDDDFEAHFPGEKDAAEYAAQLAYDYDEPPKPQKLDHLCWEGRCDECGHEAATEVGRRLHIPGTDSAFDADGLGEELQKTADGRWLCSDCMWRATLEDEAESGVEFDCDGQEPLPVEVAP